MSRRGPAGSPDRPRPRPGYWGEVDLSFDGRELLDLGIAWVALGVAFAIFFSGGGLNFLAGDPIRMVAISMLSAGVGFLLHELAHKVAAVKLNTPAAFRADYSMLFLTIMAALAGFLFAAPGAVYHPGTTTRREEGLIALAGPMTNIALAFLTFPLVLAPNPLLETIGLFSVFVNVILAGFNMIPFGPLDGKKVFRWNKVVFAAVFLPSVAVAGGLLFGPVLF